MTSLLSGAMTIVGSTLIAMLGFFVGARVGKETRDRALMREKYSTLYKYFFDLIEKAKGTDPKTWLSFSKSPDSEPPIFHMKRTGEEALFPAPLFQKMSDCEKALIVAGGKMKAASEQLNRLAHEEFVGFGGLKDNGRSGSMNTFEPKRVIRLEEEECRTLARTIFASDAGGLSLLGEKPVERLCIMKTEFSEDSLADFLVSFRVKAHGDETIKSALDEMKSALESCDGMMTELRARIAEPHHFMETVEAAFRDPLRKRYR